MFSPNFADMSKISFGMKWYATKLGYTSGKLPPWQMVTILYSINRCSTYRNEGLQADVVHSAVCFAN